MICGLTKREVGGEDRSLGAFQDFRLKLVAREAREAGFVTRTVPDGDTEYLEVFARQQATKAAGGEARAFAKLANRLRSCGLGTLSYDVDSEDEQEDVLAEMEAELAPPEWSIPVRGDGFARELSAGDRREIEALVAEASGAADAGSEDARVGRSGP